MSDKPAVLVAGATGYLGRYVTTEAASRGHRVRALARTPSALDEIRSQVTVVQGEATAPETLAGICDGIEVIFSSLGITRQTDRVTYQDVDYQANINLLREAEHSGCRRFVFVSVLHPEHTQHTDMVAARERFVVALRASKLESVVIRPTGFFADMREVYKMAQAGRCYVFGDGLARLNPIHGADLAVVCVDAFSGDDLEINVGGPDILTQREIAQLAFSALGKAPKVTGLPFWLVDALLATVKPFHRRWWNIGTFIASAGRHEMVGPQVGDHRLAQWFEELSALR
jgi:uncharacterized protein YbjT (DUF2867 family)